MKWLIFIVVLLLVAGPLRKKVLASWRLVAGLVVGITTGLFIAGWMVSNGSPPWMLPVGVLFGCILGRAVKEFIDALIDGDK